MAAVTAYGHLARDILKTPDFFAVAGENPFDCQFKLGVDLYPPSHRDGSVFGDTYDADAAYDAAFAPFANPLIHRTLTPPRSAGSDVGATVAGWDCARPPVTVPLRAIDTHLDPRYSRLQFGQVTPPDDELRPGDDDWPLHSGPSPAPEEERRSGGNGGAGKRKRAPSSSSSAAAAVVEDPAPKRSRRNARGGQGAATAVEDDRRSRFLERNRVAASKCRQKKKEWTSNLECRARELQAERNHLSLVVGSLREEVLFLKGEMLKHVGCGCAHIREYLSREAECIASGGRSPHFKAEPASPGVASLVAAKTRRGRARRTRGTGDAAEQLPVGAGEDEWEEEGEGREGREEEDGEEERRQGEDDDDEVDGAIAALRAGEAESRSKLEALLARKLARDAGQRAVRERADR